MSRYSYCLVCQRSFDDKEWKRHKFTVKHKQKLQKFLGYQLQNIEACTNIASPYKKKRKHDCDNIDQSSVTLLEESAHKFTCRFCDYKIQPDDNV